MKIKITKAENIHYNDMYKIHNEVMPENDKLSEQNFFDEFTKDTRKYFVALNNLQVVGYVGVLNIADDYNIMGIAVNKNFAYMGIGTQLIEYLKRDAKQNNIKTISLEVDEKNTIAINFYKKMGFVLTNIRKKYYKNNDAYIMWYYL